MIQVNFCQNIGTHLPRFGHPRNNTKICRDLKSPIQQEKI